MYYHVSQFTNPVFLRLCAERKREHRKRLIRRWLARCALVLLAVILTTACVFVVQRDEPSSQPREKVELQLPDLENRK